MFRWSLAKQIDSYGQLCLARPYLRLSIHPCQRCYHDAPRCATWHQLTLSFANINFLLCIRVYVNVDRALIVGAACVCGWAITHLLRRNPFSCTGPSLRLIVCVDDFKFAYGQVRIPKLRIVLGNSTLKRFIASMRKDRQSDQT